MSTHDNAEEPQRPDDDNADQPKDRDWFEDTNDATESMALDHAIRVLAACREGTLRFAEHHVPIKFIAANADGRLIASVPVATFFSSEHTLFVPEESDEALQLLLTVEQTEESHDTDRWLAHHLNPELGLDQPDHTKWAACWIDSARHGPWVFDGDPFMHPNPIAADEPRLCKALNADPDRLRAIATRAASTDIDNPVCVGVDQHGLLIRAKYGVIRAAFDEPATDAPGAERAIEQLSRG
ncbi:MAG: hypothetical protein ACTS3F_10805 [Phycisphaerales bacterium]